MEAVLFYEEDDTLIPNQRRLIGAWCGMSGLRHLMVDRTGELRRTNGNVFGSIEEALEALPGHTFVFLDEGAEAPLTDFDHPESDVIYCVGSDTDGFQGLDMTGRHVFHLPTTVNPGNSWYASTVLPIVIADRMLRL